MNVDQAMKTINRWKRFSLSRQHELKILENRMLFIGCLWVGLLEKQKRKMSFTSWVELNWKPSGVSPCCSTNQKSISSKEKRTWRKHTHTHMCIRWVYVECLCKTLFTIWLSSNSICHLFSISKSIQFAISLQSQFQSPNLSILFLSNWIPCGRLSKAIGFSSLYLHKDFQLT